MSTSRSSYAAIVMLAVLLALSVNSVRAQNPRPEDWPMPQRTSDGWSYSPLDQINRENVVQLRRVWTLGLGPGFQRRVPLVYNGIMYLSNSQGLIHAIDAATGNLHWRVDLHSFDERVNNGPDSYDIVVKDRDSDYGYVNVADDDTGNVRIHYATATSNLVRVLDATMGDDLDTSSLRKIEIVIENKKVTPIDCATGDQNACTIVVRNSIDEELWRKPIRFDGGSMKPIYDPEENLLVYIGSTLAPNTNEGWRETWNSSIANGDSLGTVQAREIDTGELRWQNRRSVAMGSLVATRGGLVFGGGRDGRFHAFDHETGEDVWNINLGLGTSTHFPITYDVGGRQYVAVNTSVSSHRMDAPNDDGGSVLSILAMDFILFDDSECPLSRDHVTNRPLMLYNDNPRPYRFFPFVLTSVERIGRVEQGSSVRICESVHRSTWSDRSLWLRIDGLYSADTGWIDVGPYDDFEAFLQEPDEE